MALGMVRRYFTEPAGLVLCCLSNFHLKFFVVALKIVCTSGFMYLVSITVDICLSC